MDPAQALADLTEISSQIRAAALADADGRVLASTLADGERGDRLARAALDLLRGAEEVHAGDRRELVQLEVATTEGSLFVVRDERHVAAAVTPRDPTSGLIFYDLKTCLRRLAEEEEEKPKARRRVRKKEAGDEGA